MRLSFQNTIEILSVFMALDYRDIVQRAPTVDFLPHLRIPNNSSHSDPAHRCL